MSNVRAAILLTILYWVVAAAFAIFSPRGDWIDLRWPLAIGVFAIPTSLLLWLLVFAGRYFPSLSSRRRFGLVGIALPFIYSTVMLGGGYWFTERRQQLLTDQWRLAALDTMSDEPLLTAQGPIGVRLRYRVTYPKGLDLDESHGAFAQVGLANPFGGFFTVQRTVNPPVSALYPAGSYEITEDFFPAFLPSSFYSKVAPSSSDRCFRWSTNLNRRYVLTADSQNLAVLVHIAPGPLHKTTGRAYRLADFYESAKKAGAIDCEDGGR